MTTKKSYLDSYFHPFELGFCGHSNSGKTTLIEKLVQIWSHSQLQVSYLKHDSHQFEIDHAGKDTMRIGSHGASIVMINDGDKLAFVQKRATPLHFRHLFIDADVLVIEGYKNLPIPKIIVLDTDLTILQSLPDSEDSLQIAYVGPWHTPPLPLSRPYFHRDNIREIDNFIRTFWLNRAAQRPLHGLILAGGRSSRMGEDKAILRYHHHKTQIQYCHDLLSNVCNQIFLSVRSDQAQHGDYQGFPILIDRFLDMGPLGGILSALYSAPNASFLAVAIDLPGLQRDTLTRLVDRRNIFRYATCYLSADSCFPEPLCTIYEPKSLGRILQDLPQGLKCPTQFLKQARIETLEQPASSLELFNANCPTDKNFFLSTRV